MTRFLIETFDDKIEHDFCFHLLKAIEFWRDFHGLDNYFALLSDTPSIPDFIPVGSLDFVAEYLKKYHNIDELKYTGIPKELMKDEYLKRNFEVKHKNDIVLKGPLFLKSATGYKRFADIVDNSNPICPSIEDVPDDIYYVSPVIQITSEWRAFIHGKRLVGLQNYARDFTLFPDVDLIGKMINDYNDCPRAYTLDVGINQQGTFLIEVHPFVSCGLYGFSDYNYLPAMFVAGFKYLLEQ